MIKGKNFETISAYVHAAALRYGDRIALSCGGQEWSYNSLNRKALQVAALLRSRRQEGENIGILTQRTFSAYAGILGALYAGCSYVPLNPKYPLQKLVLMAKNAHITTIISDTSEQVSVEGVVKLSNCISLILLPERDIEHVEPLSEPIPIRSDHLAYVLFTSGSTGEPKGVLVTHENVCCHIKHMTEMYQFTSQDRFSQTFDLSFDPSVSDIFCAWFNGATLCTLPAEEMYCVADYIQREKITFWASVPTLAHFMIKLDQLKPNIFPSLKWSTFCGEPLTQSVANQWGLAAPYSTVENLYGPTEATVYVTRHIYQKEEQIRKYRNGVVPIGQPLPGQFAALVDENLQKVSLGEVGELCVSGPQVTQGYLHDVEKTNRVFVQMPWDHGLQNRWYRTGDKALVNEHGDIECLGRIDAQIKIAGQRIELGEIESALRDITGTNEVAVIPIAYENGTPQGVASFVAKPLSETEIQNIQRRCRDVLPSAFVPKAIYSIDVLPLNASGKVDRNILKSFTQSSSQET